ncbi:MAG TPA: S41 family peptidase [Vicinamibacterales bacterium]|jgi:carboxyl-terminal processing protease
MTVRTRLIVLFVSAPILAFVVVGGMLGRVSARQDAYPHLRIFEDVLSLISSNYVEEANLSRVMRGAMRGLAEGLDADSAYLPPDEVQLFESGDKTATGETGIELTRNYYLRIIATRDNSPAARAGLHAGDFLRAINNKPTREMSVVEGRRLLRGAPGTKVTLLVIRGNAADPHAVEVTRETLGGAEVTSRLDGQAGIIRISAFGPTAAAAVASQAAELARNGATGLVVDVRDTATGAYDAGIAIARLFVPSGTISVKQMRGAARQQVAAAAGDGVVKLPAVVLVDDGTSGASELFAAALADNKRAQLVGEHTQGRAAVQKFVRLPDGSAMLVSNGWYLTPAGAQIHEKGLTPSIAVDVPDVEFGATPPPGDPILQKALETLRK